MLRSINTAHFLEDMAERKCAEILVGKKNNFSIVCTQCRLKSFEYDEFITHFKNVHLHTSGLESFKDEKILPEVEDYNAYAETSEDEEQRSTTPLRILKNTAEPPITSTPESFDVNEQSSTSSGEEITPILLRKKNPERAKKANMTKASHACSECNATYMNAKNLERHMDKCHNTNNYKCTKCDLVHNSFTELQAHKKQVHYDMYTCAHCARVFKSKKAQKIHELNHTAERNVLCDVPGCKKAFVSDALMRSHKRLVHILKPNFVCEVCGFATKRRNDLIVHRRMHTGERPFQCKICQKRFASNSLLKEHQPMHSTERPHVCDVCGKAFSRPKALYHHKHLHLGVRKFVCKVCGYAYAQMSGLSAHMRQHRQEDMCLSKKFIY